jgi:ATP-binding protein involved in chromosome partitioning
MGTLGPEERKQIMNKEYGGKCEFSSKVDACTDPRKEHYLEQQMLKLKMSKIRHKIAVISGKCGVGKSTVTVNHAWLRDKKE